MGSSLPAGSLRPAPIDEADIDCFSFYSRDPTKAVEVINASKASMVVIGRDVDVSQIKDKTLIVADNPKLHFIRMCQNVPDIPVGQRVKLGRNVIIHSGTVIGEDGLGFVKDENNEWVKFPHFGRVIIEDNVEIGANCVIDRGTLGDTVIGRGTKIENLVHVAHNAKIGKHCSIVAVTYIGGSSVIGDYAWVGPQVCIRDQIKIGSNCLIGMGSVVTKDIPDNWVVMGTPAKFVRYNE